MNKDEKQIIASMREATLVSDPPIQQKNGRWKITNRLEAWKTLGPRIFDDYLDRFQKVAIDVLSEDDPQFELDSDQRFVAGIYGKVLKHSSDLRNGLAETLALLGNYSEYLISCSQGKAEKTARLVVWSLLNEADWVRWASLNDVLPLLAEAAPEEFLSTIEKSLSVAASPFENVFAQEGSGISGRIYITGLLWGLESLAWDDKYFMRAILLLGELAGKDPGGNWSNRPANSLVTILLPWLPQTLAPIEKRIVAVKALQNEQPEVAWKLLINLLPNVHQSSSMSHKPKWRKTIPDDWSEKITNKEYWDQTVGYAELILNQAKNDIHKLIVLIGYLNNLPPSVREDLLTYLKSLDVKKLSSENQLQIWNKLIELVTRHKKFANAQWALPENDIEQLLLIADSFEPTSPTLKYQRLFVSRTQDLYEERGNYEQQISNIQNRQKQAVSEIYKEGGIDSILKFAEAVELPYGVGFALGESDLTKISLEILPELLQSPSTKLLNFVIGFLRGRIQKCSWKWVDNLNLSDWTVEQKALLLAYLPFNSETWSRTNRLLGNKADLYWSKALVSPYEATDDLPDAINHLIDNDRISAAISVIEMMIYREEPVDSAQIFNALDTLLKLPEQIGSIDPHALVLLIKHLQKDPSTFSDDLLKIEWAFLGYLGIGFDASPVLLEKKLSEDSDFFCEVIRAVFRSDKKNVQESNIERNEALARNAYQLLREWKTPPGMQSDRNFNGIQFDNWLDQVKSICTETGHLKIAMQEVGKVLFYTPHDPDGLWLHRTVASALNAKDADDLRLGFSLEIFNSRGVHFVDPEGRPEMELAQLYRNKAEQMELNGYYRLAATLKERADQYEREAEFNRSRAHAED